MIEEWSSQSWKWWQGHDGPCVNLNDYTLCRPHNLLTHWNLFSHIFSLRFIKLLATELICKSTAGGYGTPRSSNCNPIDCGHTSTPMKESCSALGEDLALARLIPSVIDSHRCIGGLVTCLSPFFAPLLPLPYQTICILCGLSADSGSKKRKESRRGSKGKKIGFSAQLFSNYSCKSNRTRGLSGSPNRGFREHVLHRWLD